MNIGKAADLYVFTVHSCPGQIINGSDWIERGKYTARLNYIQRCSTDKQHRDTEQINSTEIQHRDKAQRYCTEIQHRDTAQRSSIEIQHRDTAQRYNI